MRVHVYRNYVQSPEKPFHTPPEKKKTRQNSSIYSVSGVRLNINCVIFIHFLSLNSPLIYQFNVSWGFFSTGGFSAPHPTPLFASSDTQYCSFSSACYYPVNTLFRCC